MAVGAPNRKDGAFEPAVSPDQTQLALVTYSGRGFDLARMPYDPQSWAPEGGPTERADRPRVSERPPLELFPVREYQAWPTLRPHYWLPYLGVDAMGATLGALTSGFDVAGRHEYAAAAWWGFQSKQPGWSIDYINHTSYPDIELYSSRDVSTVAGYSGDYAENATAGGGAASFHFDQVERSHALLAGYDFTHLSVNADPRGEAPKTGNDASAAIGYSYDDTKRFLRGVASESKPQGVS